MMSRTEYFISSMKLVRIKELTNPRKWWKPFAFLGWVGVHGEFFAWPISQIGFPVLCPPLKLVHKCTYQQWAGGWASNLKKERDTLQVEKAYSDKGEIHRLVHWYGHVNLSILTSKRLFYDELLPDDQHFGESLLILKGLPVLAGLRK